MSRPLVVMALAEESGGVPESLGFDVIYCGVGKVNASYHLTRALAGKNIPLVLNLGSAGSRSFKSGTLVAADRFLQRDMDATGLGFPLGHTPFDHDPHMLTFPKLFAGLPHGVCGSGDSFVQAVTPLACDMVDMEAYALAKICHRENIPFACAKYITDGADGNAGSDWKENLSRAAHQFHELLKFQWSYL